VVQPATGGRSDLGGRFFVLGGIEDKTKKRYQRAYQA
jgi:hypothetical protein